MTAQPLTDDDPRHGHYAGYKAHYKWHVPMCEPCRAAMAAYRALERKNRPRTPRKPIVYDIDEVAVWRAMQGDPVPLNKAERQEVVRQWTAKGRPMNELERALGWPAWRYRTAA